MASSSQHEENTFFTKERDRLTAEITSVCVLSPQSSPSHHHHHHLHLYPTHKNTPYSSSLTPYHPLLTTIPLQKYIYQGFEELLSSSNNLNRKLEEVLGMTREYETIAELWQSFQDLMRGRPSELYIPSPEPSIQGMPGTGGHHVLATSGKDEERERERE